MDDWEKLRQLIINKALHFNEGFTPNGNPANWIIDNRKIFYSTEGLRLIIPLLLDKLSTLKSKNIGGPEIAANPIISALTLEGYNGFIIRKKQKYNGLQKIVEGNINLDDKVILFDDILHSGRSIQHVINSIKNPIEAIIFLINFDENGYRKLREQGLRVEYLYSLESLGIKQNSNLGNSKIMWSKKNINNWEVSVPRSSPVRYKDTILFGTNEGLFMCLDIKTGKTIWNYNVHNDSQMSPNSRQKAILSSPAVYKDCVIFGDYNGHLYCIKAETGKCVWKQKVADWVGSSPYIFEEKIIIGTEYGARGGSLCAYSIKKGSLIWEVKGKHYIHSSPGVDEKNKIAIVGCNDNHVYAANTDSGKLLWKYHVGRETKAGFAIEDGKVYFGSFDGKLRCLETKTGKVVWEKKISNQIYSTPEIVDDNIICNTASKKVFCLNKKGWIKWFYNTEGRNMCYTKTINKRVYAGSNDGFLHIINLNTGLGTKYHVGKEILTKPIITRNGIVLGCKGEYKCIKPKQDYRYLFVITFKCNDNCHYCLQKSSRDKAKINPSYGEMSLSELKKNAEFLKKRCPDRLLLTGGEPSMHPDFWEIIDYFYNESGIPNISFETNSISFADEKAEKLLDKIKNGKSNGYLELSLSTVNHYKNQSVYEKKKFSGVKRLVKGCRERGISVNIFANFTRHNYKAMPELIEELLKINNNIQIEFGLPTLYVQTEEQIMNSSIKNFEDIYLFIETSIKKVLKHSATVRFTNIPICLLDIEINRLNLNSSQNSLNIQFDKWHQFDKAFPLLNHNRSPHWEQDDDMKAVCLNCVLRERCRQVHVDYLRKNIIKKLYPIRTKKEFEQNEKQKAVVRIIRKLLPGKNCKECGYESCRMLAREIAKGKDVKCKHMDIKPYNNSSGYITCLFNITFSCNDNCSFCYNKQLMDIAKKHDFGEMSLNKIKDNAYYLRENYNPETIIITGGEPTVHPNFWDIMNFFYSEFDIHIALNTNGILFSDKKQAFKLYNLMNNAKLKSKSIELSLSTINNWPPEEQEEKRIRGVINAMHAAVKSGTPIRFFIYFTKNNYKYIPSIIDIILRTLKQYTQYNIVIEIGNLTIGEPIITKEQSVKSVVEYDKIKPYATKAIKKILENRQIRIHLYNLPLCLLDIDYNKLINKNIRHDETEEFWLRVNYSQSMDKIRLQGKKTREIFADENNAIIKYCKRCKIKDYCNKIQQVYLDTGLVKELKPI